MNRRAAIIIAAGLLLAAAAFFWLCHKDGKIPFLPSKGFAPWIVYPNPPDTTPHRAANVWATFRRKFVVIATPGKAVLNACFFKQGFVSINAQPLNGIASSDANWKSSTSLEIGNLLHAGENEISVTVTNPLGPPALALKIEISGLSIRTDNEWEVSLLGAAWEKAILASQPPQIRPGNYLFGLETMGASLSRSWLALVIILLVACSLFVAKRLWSKRLELSHERLGGLATFLLVAVTWLALFGNNLPQLAPLLGFDRDGHLQYIDYILQKGALPLADEGWQMYQPPLYYALCALLVTPFSQSASNNEAVLGLRAFSAVIGLCHIWLATLGLRQLFPRQFAKQMVGLVLVGYLPATLCLSHHLTNENLAALFSTAAFWLTIRVLRKPDTGAKLYAGIGALLGLAMLTKFSVVLVIPFVFLALIWARYEKTAELTTGGDAIARMGTVSSAAPAGNVLSILKPIGLTLVTLLLVCGWHYGRVWLHFGKPLVGNWDAKLPLSWWQEPGFHTASWFGRMGETLVSPLFSSMSGFADGIYSSLWGDGLCSGSARTGFRPQWNYDLVNADYLLALLPAILFLVGVFILAARFLRRPSPEGLLILGPLAAFAAGIIYMTVQVPSYAQVKAFYALPILLPFCAVIIEGWDFVTTRFAASRPLLWVGFAAWALTAYAACWIRPNNPFTQTVRGADFADEGHFVEAADCYKRAIALDPKSLAGRVGLADMLNRLGRREEGRQLAMEAANENPNQADPQIQLSVSYGMENRFDLAAPPMARALVLAPDHPTAYNSLGICYARLGDQQKVIETCRQGLRVSPFDSDLHNALGTAYGKTGDLTNSAMHFEAALFYKPAWPEVRARYGAALVALGRIDEAITQYRWAIQLKPGDAAWHNLIAGLYVAQGNLAAAVENYQRALSFQPDLIEALNNLAWIRAANSDEKLRDGAQAVRLAERACEITQNKEPVLLGTLAAAYAEAGKFSAAVATAEKAHELALGAGQKEVAENNRALLELYRAGKPYHEQPKSR